MGEILQGGEIQLNFKLAKFLGFWLKYSSILWELWIMDLVQGNNNDSGVKEL